MSQRQDKFTQSRLRSSNITVIISISLVLFLVGIFGIIVINANNYAEYIKEQLVMEVYLKKTYDQKDVEREKEIYAATYDSIRKLPYIKSAKFISKEQAVQIAKKELGVDTSVLFEEDVFPASIAITMKSDYVEPQKLDAIRKEIEQFEWVEEVKNDNDLIKSVYDNINEIALWIIGFSILFTLIAFFLINNYIRLKIFSKRFTIKTMQLVGAKRRFILRPFLIEAFFLGLAGAALSTLVLSVIWYYFTNYINSPFPGDNLKYTLLVIGISITGILITVGSTAIATWRFLSLKLDDLYYS